MRLIYLCCICLLTTLVVRGAELHLSFTEAPVGTLPTNYTTALFGEGRPATWKVLLDDLPSAFSPFTAQAVGGTKQFVLAQTSEDLTDEHFPLCIYEGDIFRDFTFTTRFKIVSGVTEQMAGIVFRYQNSTNFYVVRASALGQNVRFYKVVNGFRTDPIGPAVQFDAHTWHTLSVKCEGTQIIFYLDDRQLTPPLVDNSFREGKLGFWTKSDAVSYFTGATVVYRPRIPVAQQIVDGLMAEQSRIEDLSIYTLNTNGAAQIIASKDKAEIGQPGTDAEVKAIQEGAVFIGRQSGNVILTLPLHDHNGDYIAAVRFKLKSFFGETEKTALNRAQVLIKKMQEFGASADDLKP